MKLPEAFNLEAWIERNIPDSQDAIRNRELFKESDHIFQVIKGPTVRNDYHFDIWDEIFYQLHGHMFLHTIEDGKAVCHRINEGEIFHLPKNTFHSPRRPAGAVTVVFERRREQDEEDATAWFCENCGNMLHIARYWMGDIEKDGKQLIAEFNANEHLRTCKQCAAVLPDPTATPEWTGE